MLQFLPFKFFQTVFDRSFSVPDFLEFVQIFYNSFTILYMILCGIYIYIYILIHVIYLSCLQTSSQRLLRSGLALFTHDMTYSRLSRLSGSVNSRAGILAPMMAGTSEWPSFF